LLYLKILQHANYRDRGCAWIAPCAAIVNVASMVGFISDVQHQRETACACAALCRHQQKDISIIAPGVQKNGAWRGAHRGERAAAAPLASGKKKNVAISACSAIHIETGGRPAGRRRAVFIRDGSVWASLSTAALVGVRAREHGIMKAAERKARTVIFASMRIAALYRSRQSFSAITLCAACSFFLHGLRLGRIANRSDAARGSDSIERRRRSGCCHQAHRKHFATAKTFS